MDQEPDFLKDPSAPIFQLYYRCLRARTVFCNQDFHPGSSLGPDGDVNVRHKPPAETLIPEGKLPALPYCH